ncbi:MAG TPA: DUF928 domain-containing protein [Allocoleopsis sp.]
MTTIKNAAQMAAILGILGLELCSNLTVLAQTPQDIINSIMNKIPQKWEKRFIPPKNIGVPRHRQGGGTRGPGGGNGRESLAFCLPNQGKIALLVPPSGFGTTVSNTPRFFWYMPNNSANKLRFVVSDKNENDIYTQTLDKVKGKSGIMSAQLPQHIKLKNGETYNWYIELICATDEELLYDESGLIVIKGTFQITSKNEIVKKINNNTDKTTKLANYADAGLWYDTVNTLVELKQQYPKDAQISLAWQKLLKSADLEKFYQASLVHSGNANITSKPQP